MRKAGLADELSHFVHNVICCLVTDGYGHFYTGEYRKALKFLGWAALFGRLSSAHGDLRAIQRTVLPGGNNTCNILLVHPV